MTDTTPNTPANGGQILTDERILEIAQIAGKRYDSVNSMTTQATLEIGRAIEADLRASLAHPAIPAVGRSKKVVFCQSCNTDRTWPCGAVQCDIAESFAAPAIPEQGGRDTKQDQK